MALEQASDEIKLAVDLICLLEKNNIPAPTVLKALAILKNDYEKKSISNSNLLNTPLKK